MGSNPWTRSEDSKLDGTMMGKSKTPLDQINIIDFLTSMYYIEVRKSIIYSKESKNAKTLFWPHVYETLQGTCIPSR